MSAETEQDVLFASAATLPLSTRLLRFDVGFRHKNLNRGAHPLLIYTSEVKLAMKHPHCWPSSSGARFTRKFKSLSSAVNLAAYDFQKQLRDPQQPTNCICDASAEASVTSTEVMRPRIWCGPMWLRLDRYTVRTKCTLRPETPPSRSRSR